jgi:transposase
MGIGTVKRYFDREFKYEAIRLMDEGKRSVRDIAKDMDIHPNVLHQWRRKYRADMEQAFPGKGHMKAPEEEIRRLQRENEELREEKEILKKHWPSSQNTQDKVSVHREAPFRVCGEEDVPGAGCFQERLLFMDKA